MKSLRAILAAACIALAAPALPLSAQEALSGPAGAAIILSRVDANMSFRAIRYSATMEIHIGGETRTKAMEAVAVASSAGASAAGAGSDKAFIEFTNPEDRGTRYLKLGKDLWMYFPKEADTVKISGHLLKEGMMGSDLSYEDALESKDFSSTYSATIKAREALEGRDCYVVELTAKLASAPYDRRLLWIDAERWVSLKEEMYARSGRLLKTSRSLEVKRIGGRYFPVKTELVSALRKDTRTVFSLEKVEIDPVLDARQFTMAALTR